MAFFVVVVAAVYMGRRAAVGVPCTRDDDERGHKDCLNYVQSESWPAYKLSGYQGIRKYTHLSLSGNCSYQVIKSYQEIVPIRKVVVTESFPLCLGSPIAR